MKIYDVSRTITPQLPVWPGDVPVTIEPTMQISQGDTVNVSKLSFTSHLGTHVDAPYHFEGDGQTLESIPLERYIGPATLITLHRDSGPLTPADLPPLDWATVERLLIHTAASHQPLDQFHEAFVYPTPELANFLGQHNVRLFGTDAPSVDPFDSKTLAGHHALQRNGILILEGLWLAEVPDGQYELIALPLKIAGGDGCSVRAVLRKS